MAAARRSALAGLVAAGIVFLLLVAPGLLSTFAPSSPTSAANGRVTPTSCRGCLGQDRTVVRGAGAAVGWQNVTTEQFGDLPPASTGASMAYDFADQEAVWFGGCLASGCASNQTWLYRNSSWVDDTSNLTGLGFRSPASRSEAMIDYDPLAGAIVLFGGHVDGNGGGVGNRFSNDTWEFAHGRWSPIGSPCATNAAACLNPQSESSFAFDANRSVNASVLFGGCFAFLGCTAFDNETWWFNGTSGHWLLESGFPPFGAPSARAGAAMAYDPTLQALVLFGGNARCGSTNCTESDSWTYGAGTWTNVTSSFGGVVPAGRVGGSLTWDPALGELLLTGGTTSPAGALSNSTYALVCRGPSAPCNWTGPVPGAGTGVSGAALASNSSGLNPISVGGATASGLVTNATWTYSAVPDLNVGVVPSTPEVGRPVDLNVSAVGSVNATIRVLWGDGTSVRSTPGLIPHTYLQPGVENVTVAVIDPNGSANVHDLQLIVHAGPAVTIVVLYPGVDVGASDTFTAAPVLGNGTTPFNITWNFGAGPVEYGASVVHTFPAAGNQTVVASVVDALGLRTEGSVNVSVAPDPAVAIVPEYVVNGRAVADSGVSTSLLARVTGGTGPFNFTWEFGDGSDGFGPGPSHSFGGAPAVRAVSVSLADSGGGSANGAATVSVASFPTVSAISTSPAIPTAGGTVGFAATVAGGVPPGTMNWTFGDGHVGTGLDPNHSYGSSGTFTATAWWNDSAGGSAVRSVNVTVAPFVSSLTGFLLNPLVLSGILILAAAAIALYARSRRRRPPESGPSEPPADGPTDPPALAPPAGP